MDLAKRAADTSPEAQAKEGNHQKRDGDRLDLHLGTWRAGELRHVAGRGLLNMTKAFVLSSRYRGYINMNMMSGHMVMHVRAHVVTMGKTMYGYILEYIRFRLAGISATAAKVSAAFSTCT